jgi:hypothetical protein
LTIDRWQRADTLRRAWLAHCLSTEAADRERAEAAVTSLYALVGEARPTFVWVDSPHAAAARVGPIRPVPRFSELDHNVATRLADCAFTLRARCGADGPFVPSRLLASVSAEDALRSGVSLRSLLKLHVRQWLRTTIDSSIRRPIRDELASSNPGFEPLTWYGQHEHWVPHIDILHQLGLVAQSNAAQFGLEHWVALSQSCGWWWPRPGLCVLAERPVQLATEARPGPEPLTLRLHNGTGPAVAFPDGWTVHSWHGTRVPSWVVTEPRADRIAQESNVEVRRSAIERLGWEAFIADAGLTLVDTANDPGNPGCQLALYDLPQTQWGRGLRLLVAINGSVERDGQRKTYGLMVPDEYEHPVSAAAWTYGLPTHVYARLARRT